MPKSTDNFSHPYDTTLSSSLRFAVELIAWVAGPWALSQISIWIGLLSLIVLVGTPSIFSTINDKRMIVVAIPGPIRIVIETTLYAVAASAPWYIWSPFTSTLACATIALSIITGFPRALWLLRGAHS